tara:strand:- start:4089 stop:4352 length:264 start_codon:yes stop_codon:yes gene_type:complete
MEVLSTKKYNALQTAKWQEDNKTFMEAYKRGERHITEQPQLAFYLFNSTRTYGYVAFNDKKALWDKSKAGVIEYWNDEERKRKIRGW